MGNEGLFDRERGGTRLRRYQNKCTETWSTPSSSCHRNGLHPLFNIYISMGAGRKATFSRTLQNLY